MRTKAYFASSVPAALEVARRELGSDAMLVGSRPAPPHVRHLGRLEVTFAWLPPGGPPESSATPLPSPAPGEGEDIRRSPAFRSMASAPAGGRAGDGLTEWLPVTSLDPELSCGLASLAGQQPGDPESNLFEEMVRRVPVSPFAPLKRGESRTIAFIGPPGRGKTTTLIKVAVRKALARQIPVRIYTAGTHAVGGSEQMARYCSILGSPHFSFESLERLEPALQNGSWRGLSLIDTPGLSYTEHEEFDAFAEFFARHEKFERHLVLRADSRYADMLAVIERFSRLRPGRLLFTGTDETRDWSAMVGTLVQTSIPVTFEGTGRGVPEDLADADAARLVRAVLSAPPGSGDANARVQRAVA